jgi:hypothetical protein
MVTAEDLTGQKSGTVRSECKKERRECGGPLKSGVDPGEKIRRQKPTSEKQKSGVRLAPKRLFKMQGTMVTIIITCTTLSYYNYLLKLVNIGLLMVCRCRDVLPLIQQTHCVLALSCDNPVRISTQCKSYRYFLASCDSTGSEDIHHNLRTFLDVAWLIIVVRFQVCGSLSRSSLFIVGDGCLCCESVTRIEEV